VALQTLQTEEQFSQLPSIGLWKKETKLSIKSNLDQFSILRTIL
jgi:hypothetical protein